MYDKIKPENRIEIFNTGKKEVELAKMHGTLISAPWIKDEIKIHLSLSDDSQQVTLKLICRKGQKYEDVFTHKFCCTEQQRLEWFGDKLPKPKEGLQVSTSVSLSLAPGTLFAKKGGVAKGPARLLPRAVTNQLTLLPPPSQGFDHRR
jgi:hypothetical protein